MYLSKCSVLEERSLFSGGNVFHMDGNDRTGSRRADYVVMNCFDLQSTLVHGVRSSRLKKSLTRSGVFARRQHHDDVCLRLAVRMSHDGAIDIAVDTEVALLTASGPTMATLGVKLTDVEEVTPIAVY